MYPYDSDVLASSMHAVDVDPNPYTLSPPPLHNPTPNTPLPGLEPLASLKGGRGTRTHARTHAHSRADSYTCAGTYTLSHPSRASWTRTW